MGKAPLVLAGTVILATVWLGWLAQPSGAQIGPASLDQYVDWSGENADDTADGFEQSRDAGGPASGGPTSASEGADGGGSVAPDEGGTDGSVSAAATAPGENGSGDGSSERGTALGSELPDTGGPGTGVLVWGAIALFAVVPVVGVLRGARGAPGGTGQER